jgi:GTP-binding protein
MNPASARFLLSATRLTECPPDIGSEVAFAGRSNAGKSSAINYLTGFRSLARTSRTPGRTQTINFFAVSAGTRSDRRLVDLPGYGYARVSRGVKNDWEQHIDDYLRNRQSLAGVVLLMDIRHPLTAFDIALMDWCRSARLPLHIVLTKADKLSGGARLAALRQVEEAIIIGDQMTLQIMSTTNRFGRDHLRTTITRWLTSEPDERAAQDDISDRHEDSGTIATNDPGASNGAPAEEPATAIEHARSADPPERGPSFDGPLTAESKTHGASRRTRAVSGKGAIESADSAAPKREHENTGRRGRSRSASAARRRPSNGPSRRSKQHPRSRKKT